MSIPMEKRQEILDDNWTEIRRIANDLNSLIEHAGFSSHLTMMAALIVARQAMHVFIEIDAKPMTAANKLEIWQAGIDAAVSAVDGSVEKAKLDPKWNEGQAEYRGKQKHP